MGIVGQMHHCLPFLGSLKPIICQPLFSCQQLKWNYSLMNKREMPKWASFRFVEEEKLRAFLQPNPIRSELVEQSQKPGSQLAVKIRKLWRFACTSKTFWKQWGTFFPSRATINLLFKGINPNPGWQVAGEETGTTFWAWLCKIWLFYLVFSSQKQMHALFERER